MTALASALILGLVVGLPYYGLPFFYDYFEQAGWPRSAILLGLPLGSTVTLLVGPLLAGRVPPKPGIIAGAALCGVAIGSMSVTNGSLLGYYACWLVYMFGWTFAGPLAHQVLIARHFQHRRGSALALSFFGISFVGALSVACLARPLTAAFGYRTALAVIGGCILLAVPIAWLALPSARTPAPPPSPSPLRADRVFWLLALGSSLTSAGIAGIHQHLKLVLRERGYTQQARLDEVFGFTLLLMLLFSSLGRFVFAWLADHASRARILTVSVTCMLFAVPALWFVSPAHPPYLFGVLFGLGMSSDSILVALLAADRYGAHGMARPMSLIVPINTTAQTWFPYVVTLLWTAFDGYGVPLALVFVFILLGRALLARTIA